MPLSKFRFKVMVFDLPPVRNAGIPVAPGDDVDKKLSRKPKLGRSEHGDSSNDEHEFESISAAFRASLGAPPSRRARGPDGVSERAAAPVAAPRPKASAGRAPVVAGLGLGGGEDPGGGPGPSADVHAEIWEEPNGSSSESEGSVHGGDVEGGDGDDRGDQILGEAGPVGLLPPHGPHGPAAPPSLY